MPKRIPNDKDGKSVHKRQDGYEFEYYNPHSPFQRLVDTAIGRKQLSYRQAAAKIGVATSTLWTWLHNKNGFPAPRAFKADKHIPALATTLGLSEKEIKTALDASKMEFHDQAIPDPVAVQDAFADFIEILENMPGARLDKAKVVNLAKRQYAGAATEIGESHAPGSKPSPPKKRGGGGSTRGKGKKS